MDEGIYGPLSWVFSASLYPPLFGSDSLFSSFTQGLLIEAWAGSLPPDAATPSLREEEELHYATLNFHQTEPCCPQEQVAPSIEYSEIRIHK